MDSPPPATAEVYHSEQEYLDALDARGALPAGFRLATTQTQFIPAELPADEARPQDIRLSLILLDQPSDAVAAVTTRNLVVGAPVEIVREAIATRRPVQGVVINNRVANVAAPEGRATAEAVRGAGAAAADIAPELLLAASTGGIGWSLPAAELCGAAPALVSRLGTTTGVDGARAIMTTDAYPKLRSARTAAGHRVVGVAKGAGMIEPNMATLLAFLLTDVKIEQGLLQEILTGAVEKSFNRITIDGDMSTNDTVLLLANGTSGKLISEKTPRALEDFQETVRLACMDLAEKIVADGERITKVVRVEIEGAPDDAAAEKVGRNIGNSLLVKSSWYGGDPNWGRIIDSLGYSPAKVVEEKVDIAYSAPGAKKLTYSLKKGCLLYTSPSPRDRG